MGTTTLFLRLEGPLQAWGSHDSKFVVRRTCEAPTKSGVIGLLCCALGLSRDDAPAHLSELSDLRMGGRIDREGVRWWDYHTVGAGMEMRRADGGAKLGALLSRREYLCDASFLVALQGDEDLLRRLETALRSPRWTLYLGRKCCPPSRPLLEKPIEEHPDILTALASIPWQPRLKGEKAPPRLECLLDWRPSAEQPEAPEDAEIWYDVPVSLAPPAHAARFVVRTELAIGADGQVAVEDTPLVSRVPPPPRPRADYSNSAYKRVRAERLSFDEHLCVFCKAPATTVQHVTYRHAGGDERLEELRSLCRLCHDAVTMIEYGAGMGLDRINPEDPRWRKQIIARRRDIVRFRSQETRRRRLSAEEVE